MAEKSITQTYEPNPVLRLLYRRFFDSIQVDRDWVEQVRATAARGRVVYILRNLNFVDFLALDHLIKRYRLPRIRFVNDLGLGLLNPMGKGWKNAIFPRRDLRPTDELRDALDKGDSAVIFLKRPPSVREMAAGSKVGTPKEGDQLLETLLALQRSSSTSILLVPQVFVWSKRPDTNGAIWYDFLFGPREWPSPLRTVGQFLYNYKFVVLKVGKPVDLADVLARSDEEPSKATVQVIADTLLERLERERRSVTGPAYRPPDLQREQVLLSPSLQRSIRRLTEDKPEQRYEVTRRAERYIEGIQAKPNGSTVKMLAAFLDLVFHKIYAGIDIDMEGLNRIRESCKDATVVLLPSHKSHIDYLVLSFIFYEKNIQLPLIAAGDNLSFFPLGMILRGGGAFFIRRSFRGDKLYTAAISAYVRRMMRDGYAIEVFIEGGRSRTGKLRAPHFGLLSMLLNAALSRPKQTVYFAPVSISYERIVETEAYGQELTGKEKGKEDTAALIKSTEILRHRYGRINVQFGQFLTPADIRRDLGISPDESLTPAKRRALAVRLGNRVMDEINRVTAITPGALTALAILSDRQKLITHATLLERCERFLRVLTDMGVRVTSGTVSDDGSLRHDSIAEAAQMFIDGELLDAYFRSSRNELVRVRRASAKAGRDMSYKVPAKKRLHLDTTKNIIVHFFVERSLVSVAILAKPGPLISREIVRERVQALSRLFKHEFRFRADASFDEIFDDTVETMKAASEIIVTEDAMIGPGSGDGHWSGQIWLSTYAWIMRSFLEGYQIVARSLASLLKSELSKKDFTKRALSTGNTMFQTGDIELREAINQHLTENALLSFVDAGYLTNRSGKFALKEPYQSAEAIQRIEEQIREMLNVVS
ncbi:MAG: 1-acyl-sn-glycerol-3-phosphate acyltransferase [Deltaproteobacteria bacterium]|nr:1-acyl-sn-glycerol-3-phosphate acyltransferase [Deltaproteobacteria bacterium]